VFYVRMIESPGVHRAEYESAKGHDWAKACPMTKVGVRWEI
jgi:hypothetical protein